MFYNQNNMKNYFLVIKKRLAKPKYYIPTGIFALVVIVAIFWNLSGVGRADAGTIKVVTGDVVQEVSVTGKTRPAQDVSLSFERGGRVVSAPVVVGSRVVAGQLLASLDVSELQAQLMQAEAGLTIQQTKLSEYKKGTREENLQISEAQATGAKVALDNAKRGVYDALLNSYGQIDDAVYNYADRFFDNPRTNYAQVNFYSGDWLLRYDLQIKRSSLEKVLTDWEERNRQLSVLDSNLDDELVQALKAVEQTKVFTDMLAEAIYEMIPIGEFSPATVDGYKNHIVQARSKVSSALSLLNSAQNNYQSAQQAYAVALKQNDLQQAGYTAEQIIAQEAAVKQAQAQVDLIRAQISKLSLVAPIGGVVTKQEAKVGEYLSPGFVAINIIADKSLELEAYIPEVDIGKIKVGNRVKIVLDALPGEEFVGQVTYIDPAETAIDGTINFKIKVAFQRRDERFKSGLTANLDIETETKKNVLVLPQYAIIENDKGTFVKQANGDVDAEVPIETGLYGRDNLVEIVSGIKAGDMVANIGAKINK